MPKSPLTILMARPYFWPFCLFVGANGLIIASFPPLGRYAAALILLAFLPGWVWLQAF
jgi:hypothetical protein